MTITPMSAPLVERAADNTLVVSSETIADGAGVEHRAVLQLVSTHEASLERFGTVAFEMRPLPGGGHPVRIALLNEQQSTLLMTFMRNTEKVVAFKVSLVTAFFEMARQLQHRVPQTYREALAAHLQEVEAREAAEAKVLELQPAADYVRSFVADNDAILFRSVASDLNVGEGELRWALAYAGWIYRETARRRNKDNELVTEHQWSEYAAKKPYFFRVMNHEAPHFKGNLAFTLKITPEGASAISRFVSRQAAEHGSLRNALPHLEAQYRARQNKQNGR